MFRWYKEKRFNWKWDSRWEEWVKYEVSSEEALQFFDGKVWKTVPKVYKEVCPPKPET